MNKVIRIAESQIHVNLNSVDVQYQILIKDKNSNCIETVTESHPLCYLFFPEIERLFETVGIKLLFSCKWLTGREPGVDTWGVCFGGRL